MRHKTTVYAADCARRNLCQTPPQAPRTIAVGGACRTRHAPARLARTPRCGDRLPSRFAPCLRRVAPDGDPVESGRAVRPATRIVGGRALAIGTIGLLITSSGRVLLQYGCLNDVAAFSPRLAEAFGEFCLVFDHQNLHARMTTEATSLRHYEFVIALFAIRRGQSLTVRPVPGSTAA